MAEPQCLVEPVHFQAHLIRSANCRYTEVSGTPCIVRIDRAEALVLTPTWAAVWAMLDGRTLAEAVGVDVASLSPIDTRNLLEVVRRLKGMGVVEDVGPDRGPQRLDDLASTDSPAPATVVFSGFARHTRTRSTLEIEVGSTRRQTVVLADGTTGTSATCRRRFRRRVLEEITVTDTSESGHVPEPIAHFATILRALEDPSVLVTPGVVDLLAGLAERAVAPASPRR